MKKGIDFIGVGVIFFCHDGHNNFVMALRNKNARDEHGRWDIGGGSVEFGEDVIATMQREIKEEYCTDVMEYEFLGFRDVKRSVNGVLSHWITLDYKVMVDRKKVANGEPTKFDDLRWFSFDTIPENSHSQFPYFLEKYAGKLKLNK